MNSSRLMVCGILCCGLAVSALAENTTELINQLREALRKEAAEKKPATERSSRLDDYATSIANIEAMILRGDQQAEEYLSRLTSLTDSERIRSIAKQLADSIHESRDKKETLYVDEVEKTMNAASETILKAKIAKELDPVLKNLSNLREPREQRFSEVGRRAQSRVEAAVHFTSRWQDYLLNLAMHNQKGARDIMRSLAENSSQVPLVARSEIISRAQGLPDTDGPSLQSVAAKRVEEIVQKIKTLDDIEQALRELRGMRADNNSVDGELINSLAALQRSYLEFRTGISTNILLPALDSRPPLIPIKAQLLLLVLPRSLGCEKEPKPGETPLDYLQRVADEAKDKKNWPLYVKAMQTKRAIALPTNNYGSQSDWFNSFMTALNQETAAQYVDAVQSYKLALRGGTTEIPAEFIGERLAILQKEHQAQIDEAEKKSAAIRAAGPYSNLPPGYDPRVSAPPMRERSGAMTSGSPTPREIAVPAASATPGGK